jgi:hypothetical protein
MRGIIAFAGAFIAAMVAAAVAWAGLASGGPV